MHFRLRYHQHDFALPVGKFLIGRSTECQLSLDDPLVSRKHALLVVTDDSVTIQDLGSRNGVIVNGEFIDGVTPVGDRDKITIGSQELELYVPREAEIPPDDVGTPPGAVTMTSMPSPDFDNLARINGPRDDDSISEDPGEKTTKRDAFRLLGGVADKALALGRSEEAERLLRSLLMHVIQTERRGGAEVDEVVREQAGYYAARLAGATAQGKWVDYVVELYTIAAVPCSARTIDLLHEVLRKVKDIDVGALRNYLQVLRDKQDQFGPADLFLVQRIEGLLRLVAP